MGCCGQPDQPPPPPAFDNTVYAYPAGITGQSLDPTTYAPLWDQLHRRALSATPLWRENAWLSAFHAAIPCPSCREHFGTARSRFPVDFSLGNDAYFVCSYHWHEEINKFLGKPGLSLVAARLLYQP